LNPKFEINYEQKWSEIQKFLENIYGDNTSAFTKIDCLHVKNVYIIMNYRNY